ncbi:MAG: RNA polymerase sigma factor [Solirubrobacteraceae bacterium]
MPHKPGYRNERTSIDRREAIAALYEREAGTVQRLVRQRVRAPHAAIEDACQTAWVRLCAREDVSLDPPAARSWLVITAVREAWRSTGGREATVGGWLADTDTPQELPEPAGDAADPLAIAVQRDEARRRLLVLTDRERQFLALQALGLNYEEIGEQTGASRRTVERQILRARRKVRQGGDES